MGDLHTRRGIGIWVGIVLAALVLGWTALLGTVLFKLLVGGFVGVAFLLGLWLSGPRFPVRTALITTSVVVLIMPLFFFIYRAGELFWVPLALFIAALAVLGISLGNVIRFYPNVEPVDQTNSARTR
jgi:hypothetical protein